MATISFSGSIPYYFYWELFLMAVQTPVFMLIFHDRMRLSHRLGYPLCAVLGASGAALWYVVSFRLDIALIFWTPFVYALVTFLILLLLSKGSVLQVFMAALLSLWFQYTLSSLARTLGRNFDVLLARAAQITPYAFYYGLILLLAPLLLLAIDRYIRPLIAQPIPGKQWLFLSIIIISFLVLFDMVVEPNEPYSGVYVNSPGYGVLSAFISVAWLICSVSSFAAIFLLMASGSEESQLRENALRHQYQSAMQQERYAVLMARMEQEAQVRHDIRHHLVTLRTMAADGRCEDALRYIEALMPPASQGEPQRSVCENYAANAVILHYVRLCEEEGIAVTLRAVIPQHLFVQDQDLCVLLGNLLENALEACCRQTREERFVHVNIAMPSADSLAIRIENSYAGSIRQENSAFVSSKRSGHGIGTASVQEIVHSLGGFIRFSSENGRFCVKILLQKEEPAA